MRAWGGRPWPDRGGRDEPHVQKNIREPALRGGSVTRLVMSQIEHRSSLALEVYARKMERQRDTGESMDALVRGADWAQAGTNAIESIKNVGA
jgi:hypothetical protein